MLTFDQPLVARSLADYISKYRDLWVSVDKSNIVLTCPVLAESPATKDAKYLIRAALSFPNGQIASVVQCRTADP